MSDEVDHPEKAEVRPGEDLAWDRLAPYLREHLGIEGEMEVLQFPNGSANLTYQLVIGGTRLVVRRPPFGKLAAGAHDMRREHRVLSRLYRSYPRAPRAMLYCEDESVIGSRFFVSEYRSGVVVWDRIPGTMSGQADAETFEAPIEFIRIAGAVTAVILCGLAEVNLFAEGRYLFKESAGLRHADDLCSNG